MVTHCRIIKRILGCKVGHGQYVRSHCFNNGSIFTKPLYRHELPSFLETDKEDEESAVSTKTVQRILFIRHCQDEVQSATVAKVRAVSEQFSGWHSTEWTESSMSEFSIQRDPCLTQYGIEEARSVFCVS